MRSNKDKTSKTDARLSGTEIPYIHYGRKANLTQDKDKQDCGTWPSGAGIYDYGKGGRPAGPKARSRQTEETMDSGLLDTSTTGSTVERRDW